MKPDHSNLQLSKPRRKLRKQEIHLSALHSLSITKENMSLLILASQHHRLTELIRRNVFNKNFRHILRRMKLKIANTIFNIEFRNERGMDG